MKRNELKEVALMAGEILLSNGAETYRIEETVGRICEAYGLECECFSMANGIFISIKDEKENEVVTLKRIKKKSVDLYKIERINSFSRSLRTNPLEYDEAMKVLNSIDNAPNFSFKIRMLAACATSFVYTLFFNGRVIDAAVSVLISMVVYVMMEKISKVGFFQFMEYFFAAFVIGISSMMIQRFFPAVNKNNVITGAIMILLPGVALTNGIKDALYGDLFSGMVRFGEAALVLVAIGAGIGSALIFGSKWM